MFIIVYPPLDQAEEIRANPELYNPGSWPREQKTFNWYHEAFKVADRVNRENNKIIAIICEKEIV